MNTEEFLNEFKSITEKMYSIAKAKNADYAGSQDDALANFTMVETLGGATTIQGFYTRMTDKYMRFSTFCKKGILAVKDESVEDTLLDLANYCILLVIYLRNKKEEDKMLKASS